MKYNRKYKRAFRSIAMSISNKFTEDMFRFVISTSKILILFIITSAKCEHKNDNKCGKIIKLPNSSFINIIFNFLVGCHPSKRDANCQPPIGIVLNAKPSEIRANYAHAYAGVCAFY